MKSLSYCVMLCGVLLFAGCASRVVTFPIQKAYFTKEGRPFFSVPSESGLVFREVDYTEGLPGVPTAVEVLFDVPSGSTNWVYAQIFDFKLSALPWLGSMQIHIASTNDIERGVKHP